MIIIISFMDLYFVYLFWSKMSADIWYSFSELILPFILSWRGEWKANKENAGM